MHAWSHSAAETIFSGVPYDDFGYRDYAATPYQAMSNLDIAQLQTRLRAFSAERDWDQFHNPKNLACALSVEAAELLELFQWLNDEQALHAPQDPKFADRLGEEVADVLLYLLRIADVTGLNLPAVVERKLRLNAEKYPAEPTRGHAR